MLIGILNMLMRPYTVYGVLRPDILLGVWKNHAIFYPLETL
jgi:hypothetical protein